MSREGACFRCGLLHGASYEDGTIECANSCADQRDTWQARAEAAEARLAEAREVLRSVEWFQYEDDMGAAPPQCPVCGVFPEFYWHPKWDPDETKRELRAKNDHAPDCRLRAVLGDEHG